MTPAQSIGVLPCLLLLVGFGLAILPAIRHDLHLAHRPESNCPECDAE